MLDLVTALLILIGCGIALSMPNAFLHRAIPRFFCNFRNAKLGVFIIIMLGCWIASVVLHRPTPGIHDEFSYLLMGETFSHGHVANPAPPLPEFFDTFHELVHPVYASKYFAVQGLFLAVGDKLGGHPYIGLWLSSALACVAFMWMLEAWISPGWALLGGIILAVQYGIYSYWSQTYWGGFASVLHSRFG